jgi:hypothetical protein
VARGGTHGGITVEGLVRRAWAALPAGVRPALSFELLTDLATAVLIERDAVEAALARIGLQLGREGWLLPDVALAVDCVAAQAGAPGDVLRDFDAGVALGQAWAAGFLYGLDCEAFLDPLTGLGTLPVLRMRLEQIYARARHDHLDPGVLYQLFVVDADGPEPGLASSTTLIALAARLRERFIRGETIVRAGRRLVVLCGRAPEVTVTIDATVSSLATDFRGDAAVLAWVEDLPAATAELDAFLADVVRD